MRCPLKPLVALLACAVALSGIGSPLTPASPFAASVASAASPTKAKPQPAAPKPHADTPFVVDLEGPSDGTGGFMVFANYPRSGIVRWKNNLPPGAFFAELTDNTGRTVLVFLNPKPGRYELGLSVQLPLGISAENPTGQDPFAEDSLVVDVGGVVPAPPVDPKPPVVVPVDPPADGEAAKVKTPGFRCLLLYEHMKGIPDVFANREVCKYLDSHVVKGEDGKTPEWRRKDNDEPATGDFAVWKLYRETLPEGSNEGNFVSCGNGVIGYAGPAPKTGAELLALLKKYGGE